jgi:saccharopine dehydrogenase (NAD+, L-lysine-forming)
VVILGAGAVGTVVAGQLAQSKHVDRVVAADISSEKTEALSRRVRSKKVVSRTADARSVSSLVNAFRGSDMVVNATVPMFNISVMKAALKAGVHYMDMSTGGPKEYSDVPELAEQLGFDKPFREAGLAAILTMGVDPGCSNIFGKYLADGMDRTEELLVRDGDTSTVEGHSFAALFSPESLIEECLLPPLVLRNGKMRRLEPLSESEMYEFPKPVGPQRAYYVDHEEVETLTVHVKGLKRCDFMYALGQVFVDTLKALRDIGLTGTEPVKVGKTKIVPRDLLISLLPDPAKLGPKVKGDSCVGVEASGFEGRRRVKRFMYTPASHGECYRKYGVTATAFQTGVPPAIGVEMLARGDITRRGAYTPEMLDPEPWPKELARHGMPVKVIDLS